MMEIIAPILSALATALSGYAVWILQTSKTERTNRNRTYQILLRSEIRQLHALYMSREGITAEELGEVKDIYNVYHNLGGNGKATVMMEDLEKLERKE